MTWVPLSFIAALTMYKVSLGEYDYKKSLRIVFISVGIFIGAIIVAIPLILINKEVITSRITDEYVLDSLNQNLSWSGYESIAFKTKTTEPFRDLHARNDDSCLAAGSIFNHSER